MIKEALDLYAATLERKFAHDRSKTIGASEIGLCARRTYYTKKGFTGEDQSASYGAHLRGTMMENFFWAPAMKLKYGRRLKYVGRYQRTFSDGLLSATPDGLLVGVGYEDLRQFGVREAPDCVLTECKSIDPRVNIQKEKHEHAYQVCVQMGLVRKTTRFKPEYAVISYMDASFWHEVEEFAVKFEPSIFEAAEARASQIFSALSADKLAPEGWIAGGSECEYCPFTKQCGIVRKSVPESEAAQDPQFVAELSDLARRYHAAKSKVDDVTSEVRSIQEEIKQRLRDRKVRKIPGVVSWSTQKGRESYDMKGIREAAGAAGVDVDSFCTVGEPTDRLDVRLKGSGTVRP